MNEDSSLSPSVVPDDPFAADAASLLKSMQQQLLFLEKKIDLLISQSQERQSREKASPDRIFRKRPFSRPFRSYDHPQRQGKGEHGHSSKERDSAPGHYYEHRPREKNRGPNSKRKPFSFKRKDRE